MEYTETEAKELIKNDRRHIIRNVSKKLDDIGTLSMRQHLMITNAIANAPLPKLK